MIISEKQLQDKVIKYLKELQSKDYPIYFEKRQAGGFNYKIGLPDLWIVINGQHIEVELKDPSKKIEYKSEQVYWLNKFNKIGIKTIISNDYDRIIKLINSYLY